MAAGELALAALRKLADALGDAETPTHVNIVALGDFVYNIKEREGEGWKGDRVLAFAEGCRLAMEALKAANMETTNAETINESPITKTKTLRASS